MHKLKGMNIAIIIIMRQDAIGPEIQVEENAAYGSILNDNPPGKAQDPPSSKL